MADYSSGRRKNSASLKLILSGGHPWEKSLNVATGKATRHLVHNIKKYCKCKGFHQRTIGSVTIVLTRSAIDSDFTDIYLHEIATLIVSIAASMTSIQGIYSVLRAHGQAGSISRHFSFLFFLKSLILHIFYHPQFLYIVVPAVAQTAAMFDVPVL